VQLDNASLLARRVYARNLDLFDDVYLREGMNLRRAIGRIISLAKSSPKAPYDALRRWLGQPSPPDESPSPTERDKSISKS
jgi:hypothetical protein